MLFRNILKNRSFNLAFQGKFNGSDLRHKFPNEIKDEDYEKFDHVFDHPPRKDRLLTLSNLFAKFPLFRTDAFLKLLSSNFDSAKSVPTSDYFNPPKISENSIFVHQSTQLSASLRKGRSIELFYWPIALVGFENPLLAFGLALPVYLLWANAYYFELSRRLVVRMDILPHIESVNVQRIGAFGHIYNKIYRTKDLQYVKLDDVYATENYFFQLQGHNFDKDLMFKCKVTGDYLLFDRYGLWNKEGLEHPLLN